MDQEQGVPARQIRALFGLGRKTLEVFDGAEEVCRGQCGGGAGARL